MIDPRASSLEQITPPEPLPYVSRKALKRITDYVEPPECCPNCGNAVLLVNHREIYGREYGDWPYAYRCIDHRGCIPTWAFIPTRICPWEPWRISQREKLARLTRASSSSCSASAGGHVSRHTPGLPSEWVYQRTNAIGDCLEWLKPNWPGVSAKKH